mgnify:CR=1 FL=1
MIRRLAAVLLVLWATLSSSALAQSNRIDVVTPVAPELAAYGKYDIGVRTLQATHSLEKLATVAGERYT